MLMVQVLHLLPEERQHLLALLESLAPDEWGLPTACPGWSVHDVALHLLGDDLGGVLSRQRDGFADPRAAAGVDFADWAQLVAFLNRHNAAWVEATRRLSPRLLIELLAFSGERTRAYFAGLDPHAPGPSVSWAGPEPAPNWLGLAREYTERWTHQQHIRDSVGRPGLKEPRFLAPVLATFAHALPRALRGGARPPGTRVRFTVEGPAGGAWDVVAGPAGWRLEAASPKSPAASLALDQETAWRLFTRGLPPAAAAAAARTAGDAALARRLLDAVAIIA